MRLIRIEIEFKELIAGDLTQLMQFIGINPNQTNVGGDLEGRRFTCPDTGKVFIELFIHIDKARAIFQSSKEIFQLLIQELREEMSHSLRDNNSKIVIAPKNLFLLTSLCPGVNRFIDPSTLPDIPHGTDTFAQPLPLSKPRSVIINVGFL